MDSHNGRSERGLTAFGARLDVPTNVGSIAVVAEPDALAMCESKHPLASLGKEEGTSQNPTPIGSGRPSVAPVVMSAIGGT